MRQGLAFAQGLHRGVAVVQGEAVVAIGLELQGAQCSFHRLRRHARAIGSLGVVAQHIAADRQLATILTHTVAVIRGGRDVIDNLDRQTTAAGIAISVRRHHRRVIKQRLAAVIGLSQQGVGVIHYPITKAGYRQLVTQPGRHQQRIGCAGPLQTG